MILCRLAVIASLFTPNIAVPTFDRLPSQNSGVHSTTHSCTPSPYSSPFRRLRDSIIERIWNIPETRDCRSRTAAQKADTSSRHSRRYDDEIVLRFNISSPAEVQAFSEATNILYLDIWDSTAQWIDIRIARRVLPSLLDLLPTSLHNAHTPLIHDLAQAVHHTYPSTPDKEPWKMRQSLTPGGPHDMFFNNYQPLSIMYPWLKLLAREAGDFAELLNIGKSAEGRDILGLRIHSPKSNPATGSPRQTILITAGTHGREWISVSTSNYIIHTMLSRLQWPTVDNHQALRFLKQFDIVFIPVLNPDGYAYTWTTDRLWRKTRQSTSLPFCPGLDLDRSFPFAWDGTSSPSTDNPCTESYAGSAPLEAIEAKVLADWIKSYTEDDNELHSSKIAAYIDLHSYSQQILFPYSHSCSDLPHNFEDLLEVALGLSKSLRSVHKGAFYSVSPACQITDDKTVIAKGGLGGSALDYMYHDIGVKYAFQIKLRDQGSYGFLLPRSEIIPSGREAVSAVLGLGEWLLGDRGIESSDGDDDTAPAEGKENDADDDDHSNKGMIELDHAEPGESYRSGSDIEEKDNDAKADEIWGRVYDPNFELDLR